MLVGTIIIQQSVSPPPALKFTPGPCKSQVKFTQDNMRIIHLHSQAVYGSPWGCRATTVCLRSQEKNLRKTVDKVLKV